MGPPGRGRTQVRAERRDVRRGGGSAIEWRKVNTGQWMKDFRDSFTKFQFPFKRMCVCFFWSFGYYPDMAHKDSVNRYMARNTVVLRKISVDEGFAGEESVGVSRRSAPEQSEYFPSEVSDQSMTPSEKIMFEPEEPVGGKSKRKKKNKDDDDASSLASSTDTGSGREGKKKKKKKKGDAAESVASESSMVSGSEFDDEGGKKKKKKKKKGGDFDDGSEMTETGSEMSRAEGGKKKKKKKKK